MSGILGKAIDCSEMRHLPALITFGAQQLYIEVIVGFQLEPQLEKSISFSDAIPFKKKIK